MAGIIILYFHPLHTSSFFFSSFSNRTMRESLIISEGKGLQSSLMIASTFIALIAQAAVSSACTSSSPSEVFKTLVRISALLCILTFTILTFSLSPSLQYYTCILFYHYHSFFNMTCISLFWGIAGDALSMKDTSTYGYLAAAGTAGQLISSTMVSITAPLIGTVNTLPLLAILAVIEIFSIQQFQFYAQRIVKNADESARENEKRREKKEERSNKTVLQIVYLEFQSNLKTLAEIWNNTLLRSAFLYTLFNSCSIGLNLLERTSAAKRNGLDKNTFAEVMGANQFGGNNTKFILLLSLV